MVLEIRSIKTMLLAALIVVGWGIQCQRAHAASSERLVVAGGCFWCVESDFESVSGVKSVVSGYTGGTTKNPTYKQVARGGTGHYEAVTIEFDPARISREKLLNMFFRSIDPTDAGGQFCDRGASYRTAIFVNGETERKYAEKAKANAGKELRTKVVTPILNAEKFYKAEAYHQDYYRKSDIVLTRRGPKSKSEAYKFYRKACGRDKRVKKLWGKAAPFARSY